MVRVPLFKLVLVLLVLFEVGTGIVVELWDQTDELVGTYMDEVTGEDDDAV